MKKIYSRLVKDLTDESFLDNGVIPWGSPVPSFGDFGRSKIATLGINPSNREFVDEDGNEIRDSMRRFHTLSSLKIKTWKSTNSRHIDLMRDYCQSYFGRNPYDLWFKKLDYLISGTGYSYYAHDAGACHLDLIPYATFQKWTDLRLNEQDSLLNSCSECLGLILKNSPIKVLVLNGATVIHNVEKVTKVELEKRLRPNWALPRNSGKFVSGYSYTGFVSEFAGIPLKRKILLLGFNHNIQSSFGVTKEVQTNIRNWITRNVSNL